MCIKNNMEVMKNNMDVIKNNMEAIKYKVEINISLLKIVSFTFVSIYYELKYVNMPL